MCRTGARRCPACSSRAGLDKHNARRRRNRAMKDVVLALAESVPGAPVDDLQKMAPTKAKAWAVGHGISEQAIAAAMPPDRPPRRFRTDRPERSRAGSAAQVRPPATRAGEFTAETTALWSDEQLEQALTEVWDDQQAVDAIATLIDSRQAADDAVARAMAGQFEDPRAQAWSTEPGWARRDELVDPGLRPTSRLTADQQLRADYETYVDTQWLQAEADCNGQLLTPAARQMGLDSRSLFSGSTSRAVKYASEELQSWWQRHGRLTLAAFRHQAFGRDSDRSAAEQARLGHFDNAAAW